MRLRSRPFLALLVAPLAAALVLVAACDDSALNEFGAEGALQTTLTIELHDGWIGSPQAAAGGVPGGLASLRVPPHNDITFQVANLGLEPHAFALYANAEGTELLASSWELPPGGSEAVTYHFHDDQIAYFFDDAHREQMRGEIYVHQ